MVTIVEYIHSMVSAFILEWVVIDASYGLLRTRNGIGRWRASELSVAALPELARRAQAPESRFIGTGLATPSAGVYQHAACQSTLRIAS
jgi:hypothetical protein